MFAPNFSTITKLLAKAVAALERHVSHHRAQADRKNADADALRVEADGHSNEADQAARLLGNVQKIATGTL